MNATRSAADTSTVRDLFKTLGVSLFLAAALGLSVWLIWPSQTRPTSRLQVPRDPVSLEAGITLGSAHAKVAVIEFSDFQCPFCGRFARDVFPSLRDIYISPGAVLWVFHQMPLSFHQSAEPAAEASECANEQARFWEMHDLLFRSQDDLTEFGAKASSLGLDRSRFQACLRGQMSEVVARELDSGHKLGVQGTPTFFLGIRSVSNSVQVRQAWQGFHDLGDFRSILDSLLQGAS
jgi:protein-disulfide isomerase